MNPLIHFPAHLITGNTKEVEDRIVQWIQESVPHTHDVTPCTICDAITTKNFYALTWIAPENRYILENIEPIFSRIRLQLPEQHHHFFVITRAELLTQACANILLKVVEEPPTGYHFIFSAPHKNLVIPTIVSRCVETAITSSSTISTDSLHTLVQYGYATEHNWPEIYKEIAQYSLNEHQTVRLFETLFNRLTVIYKKKCISPEQSTFSLGTLEKILHFCKDILDKPLQAGSAKIMWRDFFMYKVICMSHRE